MLNITIPRSFFLIPYFLILVPIPIPVPIVHLILLN